MSTGGKPPPLLVPGLGKTLQRSPVMQRKDTVSTAATVWAGQSGLLKGGAQSLVGKTQLTEVRVDQAVKSRGSLDKVIDYTTRNSSGYLSTWT